MAQVFLIWLLPLAILVPISIAAALLGLLQYRLAGRVSSEVRVAAAVLVVGIGTLLSVALTSRNLNETLLRGGEVALYEDYASGFAASRSSITCLSL